MMVLLLFFGGVLVNGLLGVLVWMDIVVVLVILFVIRLVMGLIGLVGLKVMGSEKLMIVFFGIWGVGLFYYLVYGFNSMEIDGVDCFWVIVGLVVVILVFLYGLIVMLLMWLLDCSYGCDFDVEGVLSSGL